VTRQLEIGGRVETSTAKYWKRAVAVGN
jgi:hypothetical protein